MKPSIKVIMSGGGTGGHIYPAISIADEIKRRYPKAEFLFVGAKNRMEMEKVPQAGYEIIGLDVAGIQRSASLKNLSFPFKLLGSLKEARKIMKGYKPDVVIGTGGFASGPTLFVANFSNIPTVIQEQNSFPGVTNKWLSKKAKKICVAYDGLETFFPAEKIIKTGNPVRQDLISMDGKREEAIESFGLNPSKKTLAVIGGSLGSGKINETVNRNLDQLLDLDLQILWQTGNYYFEKYKHHNDTEGVTTLSFIKRMDFLYAASDFIVSRAGAGTISELCIVGKPVIFIPSPNVAEDHQTKNALALVKEEAAIMLKESELEGFNQTLTSLIDDKKLQEQLSENIKKLALPNATKTIVDEIEKLIK
ncbi:undecaprenyldiphospho-muramoylpentapeptide beta-N-acetylglucosaminyltransferase [Namhaeicola litoreus]|uniref:UDP-N-acetylglucosamine--N-acetylmuramyl-(pentapeptide) pyrophosphoryl-undecaprenol N-acetylglucosamine transferase n=1 Tax=Namhaeicola litoreus TaxID=1052145 RepID=A0ABW3XXX1_9FLAO